MNPENPTKWHDAATVIWNNFRDQLSSDPQEIGHHDSSNEEITTHLKGENNSIKITAAERMVN